MTKLSDLLAGQSNLVTDQELSAVATSGSYSDLTNKPVFSTNTISQGDSAITVSDTGTGKVTVTLDSVESTSFSKNNMVIPRGTTLERPSNPEAGSFRFNTSTNQFETFAGLSWVSLSTPATISSVSPTTFNGEQGAEFHIYGAFFDSGTSVKFVTSAGTQYVAASVAYVNSTELVVVTPKDFSVAEEPLSVLVTNISGVGVTSAPLIDCGGSPTWSTSPGILTTTTKWNDPVSVTVEAVDPDTGASVSYSIVSGALPSGLTLNNSTGSISGTSINQNTTTYNFTVRATDNAGNNSTDRAFSLTITNAPPVWSTPIANATLSIDSNVSFSQNLSAIDPEGQAVTYSLYSGTLPAGITLSGNIISGATSTSGTSTVVIRASDGYTASDRTFSLIITAIGQVAYTTAGTYSWVCPEGVYSVSAVAVGGGGSGGAAYWAGGGGGGGGLGYKNNIPVVPGNSYTVVVGAGGLGVSANAGGQGTSGTDSYFISNTTVKGGGGAAGTGTSSDGNTQYSGGAGGSYVGDGGGTGGTGGTSNSDSAGGGGGAAGYSGNGGNGAGNQNGFVASAGSGGAGSGGAVSSAAAGSGGGVGILGQGSTGTSDSAGGSGGAAGSVPATAGAGGAYGGGGGGQSTDSKSLRASHGGVGAVRLIWPGTSRAFPSTNTGNL